MKISPIRHTDMIVQPVYGVEGVPARKLGQQRCPHCNELIQVEGQTVTEAMRATGAALQAHMETHR